jgi:polar amino acid transport system substrate-binding protein
MKTLRLFYLLTTTFLLFSCSQASDDDAKKEAVEAVQTAKTEQPVANQNNPNAQENVSNDPENCELTMGWAPWEPYQYKTRDGKLTGLDIEIIRATEVYMDCKILFKEADWAQLLEWLQKGELDAVASAGMTEQRRKYAYFSEPYRSESYSIYVRKDDLDQFSGQSVRALLDMRMRFGAVTGYSYGVTLADYQDSDKYQKLFTYNEISETNFLMLFDDKLDGVIADSIVGSDMIRRRNWSNLVAKLPLVIHSGDVHVMFSKKSVSEDMVQKMNNALAKLKASGDYRRLIELYGG